MLPLVSFTERIYRSLSRAAWLAAPTLGRGDSKLARAVRARRYAGDRLTEWARVHRDLSRPLLWIHAPSVGEGLQAMAVVEAVRERRSDFQIVFTHFSPSAEGLAVRLSADVAGPLPWDTPQEAGRSVTAVRPDVLAFTKTEVWPVLAAAARTAGATTALVAATLPPGASRLWWPARSVLRPTLSRLELVAAVGADDAGRLIGLGAAANTTYVTGDPGIDSAAQRVRAVEPAAPYLRPFATPRRPTVVAGSTWPSDETVLVPALVAVRRHHPSLRAVIAPHEPGEEAVRALEVRVKREGWRSARLGQVESVGACGDADLVVVDRVGVLAELYTVGDVAWVGGGFHGHGLHSVLEPAAASLPVLFGPRHRNARAAGELLAWGGGRVVRDVDEAVSALEGWLEDADARAVSGASASRYIEAHLGAAGRTADLLTELIRDR
jgi:3-deoxy-D-manno-octulosonic-acid transferase